jgi:hypothetical protein
MIPKNVKNVTKNYNLALIKRNVSNQYKYQTQI